jgi:hypothetical protein
LRSLTGGLVILRYSLTTLVSIGLFCASSAAQDDTFAHASLLPGRVLASITIHDATSAAREWDQAESDQIGEACRAFLESVKNDRSQISNQLRDEIGITLDELSALKLCQMTLAAVKVRNHPVSMVLLIDIESDALIERVVERLATALRSADFSRTESTIAETRVTVFHRKKNLRELVVGIRDSVLCLSTNSATFRELMHEWKTDTGTLNRSAAYRSVVQNCQSSEGQEPLLTWFADPIGLFEESVIQEEEDSKLRQFLLGLVSRTGLDQLKAIGGTFAVNDGKFASVNRVQLVMGQPRTGILRMLRLQSDDLRPRAQILSNATCCYSVNWDLQAFFDGSSQLLEIVQGHGALNVYVNSVKRLAEGFDIKRDLLDRLTGRMHLANIVHDSKQYRLVALQVRDPQAIGEFLEEMARTRLRFVTKPAIARKYGELTVYEQPVDASRYYIVIVDDMLCIAASEAVIVKLVANSERPSLSTDYERVSRFFPEKCVARTFESQCSLLQGPWEYLRTQTRPQDTMGVNFSLLPPFDSIKSRFGPSASFAVENETGLLFTHFTLATKPCPNAQPVAVSRQK